MSEIKRPAHLEAEKNPIEKFQQFWEQNGKMLSTVLVILVLVVGGYLGYKNWIKDPNEAKATEAMFRAEEYFKMDSTRLALNGDNVNAGFLKIISRYSGTRAANLASFYAGSCYLKLGDFNNAVKYLKDFSSSVEQVQIRAFGLLGDAYSELNKRSEAADQYKKAGTYFEKDDLFSPEYLFRAGYLYESMGKNQEAIEMYRIIKDKYPASQRGYDIDKYLARLGVIAGK
ncbi:MAG: tetratricopeptide repeat protein [Bacteroidota bacterium]|nr:tetratricopeptide repeat protein [Bacteroidota bacterium]MDP4216115.1 tetratricopeptide repeat protein [Bacteroidota bacterium]MDP4245533.1 tetratricopeptide repeat protein [Bacteroidota bacterium]MDP4252731.1 tetratricopeptide repeat protein [Bacteroidota bacterium]MDP4259725.1 tetratricopeptide repeat protein [Bacteroidota bacterium]